VLHLSGFIADLQHLERAAQSAHGPLILDAFTRHSPFDAGAVWLRSEGLAKTVTVAKRNTHPVAAPFREFHNTQASSWQDGGTTFLRAAGDFPLLQFGDQYASIYQPKSLGTAGVITVKLENPELRTNWVGRAGIVVRNDLDHPGSSPGYLIVAASPAAGVSMEWDENGDGLLDRHTPFDGNTVWPVWVRLERHGSRFTGSYSGDGEDWTKLADVDLPAAAAKLDVGMIAYRSSALFEQWKIR